MKGLARFCRLILGLVFLFSGFVKLLSPVGTSLIIKEYLAAFHLGFLSGASVAAAVVLSLAEFLTGVAMLLRLRLRIFSWVALVLTGAFTLLTLYLAIFNPIDDCGCFGEVVHLSNWQTFFKNLVLLPCAVIIFVARKKITEFRYPVWEWIFVGLFAALGLFVLLRTFLVAPIQESTPYGEGTEISAAPAAAAAEAYETVFIYEKDGRRQTFDLDNLPDESWTYVDAVTTEQGNAGEASDSDFRIESLAGEDITADVLSADRLLLMSFYHPDRLSRRSMEAIGKVRDAALAAGMEFLLVSSAPIAGLPDGYETGTADLKLLMTLNRSNGGVTYLNRGMVVRKWASSAVAVRGPRFYAADDPEMELLRTLRRQRLTMELLVVAFLALCLVKFAVFYKCRV